MSKEYKINGFLYEESETQISDSYLQLMGSGILAKLAGMDRFLKENNQISVCMNQEWAIQLTPYASISTDTDKLIPIIRILYRSIVVHQTILTPEKYRSVLLAPSKEYTGSIYDIFKEYDTHPINIQGVCGGSLRNRHIGYIRHNDESHAIIDARICAGEDSPFQGISICTQSLNSGKIGIYSAFNDQITYLVNVKGV